MQLSLFNNNDKPSQIYNNGLIGHLSSGLNDEQMNPLHIYLVQYNFKNTRIVAFTVFTPLFPNII